MTSQVAAFPLKQFGDLVDWFDHKRVPVKSSDRKKGPYPYYGASGVVDWVDGFLFEGLHLLVSEDGENLRSRTTPIAFLADGRFWVNNHAHVVKGNACADTRFLSYAMVVSDISGHISGSAQPKLSQASLRTVLVPAPELRIQQAIAEVLGALDDKIAANEAVSSTAEELLRARFTQLGLMDESRADARLAELIEFQPKFRATGEIPFYDMQALPTTGWTLPAPDIRKARGGARFGNGDTLLARITPCLENRKAAYVDALAQDAVGGGSTEFIVMRSRDPYPQPLSFFIATDESFRSYAIQHMVGTSGRQRVAWQDLADCPVALPDTEEVKVWGELAVPIFARVRALGRENRALAELRDALLPELMSGRLRVKDAENTVEEVL